GWYRPDRACSEGRTYCRGTEPLQRLGAQVRGSRRLLCQRKYCVHSILSTARHRWWCARGDRRATRSDRAADRACVAPPSLADNAANPWHLVARALETECGGVGNRIVRRRVCF